MNSKMLMLGILLIAGVSFAAEMPDNWMMYLADRYACNYVYNEYGYAGGEYDSGLMDIPETYDNCDDPEYWNCEEMGSDIKDMAYALDGEGGWQMYVYAGCLGEEGMSATNFRSSVLAFNIASASFKSYFNAGLRAYLADGGDRSAVLQDMQEASIDYRTCLMDAYEYGACWLYESGPK